MKSMNSTIDLNMVNAYVPGRADVGPATAAMIARRDSLLGPAYRLMYERPLHIVRGEGAWLIDPEGRRYLDAYNNVVIGFRVWYVSLFYVAAMLALGLHLWHGTWSGLQTLGVIDPRWQRGVQTVAAVVAVVTVAGNVSVPLAVLTGVLR